MQRARSHRILRGVGLAFLVMVPALCRAAAPDVRHEIAFPDLPGYQTLACDLHMHTVFSDGNVWPPVRVNEAWRQGLDVIAITDHIEYQPHKADLPTNFNRSYELAQAAAKSHGILLVHAAEITRDTPPGHFNALFLEDTKPLDKPDLLDVLRTAHEQKAFVFWNHQAWQGEEKGRWLDIHTTMYENKWLNGMEVANGGDYYPSAHKWCLEKNLTMLGNTDIHDPDLLLENTSRDHRTMTLVLAKERTLAGVQEALEAGRTIVWCKDQLIGRAELLRPFFDGCIQVGKPTVATKNSRTFEVHNTCAADITLGPKAGHSGKSVVVPALSTVLLNASANDATSPVTVPYTAKNFLIAPGQVLEVELKVPGL